MRESIAHKRRIAPAFAKANRLRLSNMSSATINSTLNCTDDAEGRIRCARTGEPFRRPHPEFYPGAQKSLPQLAFPAVPGLSIAAVGASDIPSIALARPDRDLID